MGETIKAKDISNAAVTVSAEELRINLADYLARVRYADTLVVVERYNQECAYIISPKMLRRLIDSSKANKADRESAIQRFMAVLDKVPDNGLSEDEVADIAQNAIDEVRASKKKTKAL